MLTAAERALHVVDFATARDLWIFRARLESQHIAGAREWMIDNGFEEIRAPSSAPLTDDGREILRAHGRAWALRPEIHAQRLAEAMERAKQRSEAMVAWQQPAAPPTTCAALIDGQLCGGTLVRASVCPLCALGKQGVVATLTCDVCGHVSAIMRGDA